MPKTAELSPPFPLDGFGMPPTVPLGIFAKGEHLHVMIVDDSAMAQVIARSVVEALGVERISVAGSGLECLDLIDRGAVPDLILLDVMMPGIDGYETCRRLRQRDGLGDLTIVIQTALDGRDDRLAAFAAGATDLVSKPIFPAELEARLIVHLQNRLMMRSLKKFSERMTDQLRMASRMQHSIMPQPDAVRRELADAGVQFDAFYRPCDEVGGDFWQVTSIDSQRVAVTLLDINGHGLVAAINAFRCHGLISTLCEHAADPSAWMAALNAGLHREFNADVLATALRGVLDVETGRFRYASAGWMPPLIVALGDDEVSVRREPSNGIMLGMLSGVEYPLREAALGPGEALLLYSDGLCLETDGTEITPERLDASVIATVADAREAILRRLIDDLPCRLGAEDDVMALWFGRHAD